MQTYTAFQVITLIPPFFFLGYILMASSAVYSLPPRLESKNLRLVLFPLPVVLTTSFDLKIKESFPEDFCF